jgi:hypothetical protein
MLTGDQDWRPRKSHRRSEIVDSDDRRAHPKIAVTIAHLFNGTPRASTNRPAHRSRRADQIALHLKHECASVDIMQ